MDAHTIKKALINYKKNIEIVERLNWRLTEMRTKLYEGGTSSVIRMPEGTPKDRSNAITDYIEKEHKILDEIDLLSKELEIADEFLGKVVDFKEMIIDKYLNGVQNIELCNKYGYTRASINRKIDEQIYLYSE